MHHLTKRRLMMDRKNMNLGDKFLDSIFGEGGCGAKALLALGIGIALIAIPEGKEGWFVLPSLLLVVFWGQKIFLREWGQP